MIMTMMATMTFGPHNVCCVGQIILVELAGPVFSTTGLPIDLWLWCLVFGIGELAWGQVCDTWYYQSHCKYHVFLLCKLLNYMGLS